MKPYKAILGISLIVGYLLLGFDSSIAAVYGYSPIGGLLAAASGRPGAPDIGAGLCQWLQVACR